jgi:hypothetical protein
MPYMIDPFLLPCIPFLPFCTCIVCVHATVFSNSVALLNVRSYMLVYYMKSLFLALDCRVPARPPLSLYLHNVSALPMI